LFSSALVIVSFSATLVWVWHARSASQPAAFLTEPASGPAVATPASAPAPVAAESVAAAAELPVRQPVAADYFDELVEDGIYADDSEQRSLAIVELSQAPVEQALPALQRILRENRDSRSRITALEQLMQLPDSPEVADSRRQLLAQLARDEDHFVAEAARMAATPRS
jgi:hypothetical protein